MLLDEFGHPALAKPIDFEEFACDTKCSHFDESMKDIGGQYSNCKSGASNGDTFSAGRKKAKLDTVARLSTLWIPQSPRIISVGSRITQERVDILEICVDSCPADSSGDFLVTGADHYKAIIKTWYKVFGTACELPDEQALGEIVSSYEVNKWDWSKLQQFSIKLAEDFLKFLKSTAPGKDGIHNLRSKYGGKTVLVHMEKLFDTFMNGGKLPWDINGRLFTFLSKAEEDDDRTLSAEGIYRGPTDFRPLILKTQRIRL